MSAFVVGKEHIDAIVSAGLRLGRPAHLGWLRWMWPAVTDADRQECYAAGQPWGPRAVELYEARKHELAPDSADRVGAMLWAENVRSVAFRYDEPEDAQDLPGPIFFGVLDVAEYRHRSSDRIGCVLDAVGTLKALDCLEYQSCEHPGWEASEARAFVEALRRRAIACLPGYDQASWDVHAGSTESA
jgi:hypothetical protein